MEIQEIKGKLTISEVIKHYGLKADKQNRLKCPFHDDKTPSLQLYYKTQTAFCFSTNCTTHGKAIDVIDFILYYEKCTKHEAIKKAIAIIGGEPRQYTEAEKNNRLPATGFLDRMFTYFKNAIHNSQPAKDYLQKRSLDFKQIEVGYNAGQFHHGTRKDEALIKECLEYGILLDLGMKARTGDTAYKPFGKWCVCFALRNKENNITGLYFRSTLNDKEQRHFYMKDRQGLYPNYPKAETKKLILTESIIDAATLLQQGTIKNNYEILSLFGTNGFTEEHQTAIKDLQQLEEIIFFLNGDEAGIKAVAKYAPMFKAAYPNIKITNVAVPQNEDVNSLLQGHSPEILIHLINTRKETEFIFSTEKSVEKDNQQATLFIETTEAETITNTTTQQTTETTATGLNTNNPYNLKYQGNEAQYQIKGFRVEQMDSLKITLQIQIND
jgi:DNA primase